MKSFDALWSELEATVANRPSGSGTISALDKGTHHIAKKVLEEAGEVMAAADHQSDSELAAEMAQLLYWIQVLALSRGIAIEDIYRRL